MRDQWSSTPITGSTLPITGAGRARLARAAQLLECLGLGGSGNAAARAPWERRERDYLLAGLRRLQARLPRIIGAVGIRGRVVELVFAPLHEFSPLLRLASRQGFLGLLVASYLRHWYDLRFEASPGNPGESVLHIPAACGEPDRVLEALAEACTVLERNHEGVLLGHLLGVTVSDDERRNPRRCPVLFPEEVRRLAPDGRVGFIMHPAHAGQVLGYYLPSLAGRVDARRLEEWWSRLARFLEPELIHSDYVTSGGFLLEVNLVSVPFLPRELAETWRAAQGAAADEPAALRLREIQDRVQDAARLARALGDDVVPTSIVGLGAFTSIVTAGGTTLDDAEVPVTTGNAYTAGLMYQGILEAAGLQGIAAGRATAAVVGGGGNIGSVLGAMLAGEVAVLRLVGSESPGSMERLQAARRGALRHAAEKIVAQVRAGVRLDRVAVGGIAGRVLRDELARTAVTGGTAWGADLDAGQLAEALEAAIDSRGGPEANPYMTLHTSVAAVRDCDIVTIATSSPAARLITPSLVKRGAVVSCASVPSNLSAAFRDHLDEYLVFDGGYARLPEGQTIDFPGLPAGGLAFGCMSETLLLGFAGRAQSFARGPIAPAQVEETLRLAGTYGFGLGEFKLNDAVHPVSPERRAAA